MSKTAKIILSILAFLALSAACVVGLSVIAFRIAVDSVVDQVQVNPNDVAGIVDEIAEIEIPAGFQPMFGAEVANIQVTSFSNGDEHTHLYIAQAPANIRLDEELRNNVDITVRTQYDYHRLETISDTTTTIRGQDARILVSMGRSGEGRDYQEMTVFFQGMNGTALVSLITPAEAWDQDLADALVASIH